MKDKMEEKASKHDETASAAPKPNATTTDFIREIIRADVAEGKHGGRVLTRFPPEPNGYLHIGHAKSICLNFGLAADFGGTCNLRFDDTNPIKEEEAFVRGIVDDVHWLGFDWAERLYYASDYFERLYEFAVQLIREGRAYVDSLTAEEIREHRGTLTEPGRESPYRSRSPEANLDLFARMRAGEFPDGSHVLRAKIDMRSGNVNLRDPVMYRVLHARHHRTGDHWCIYPLYDWAHGQSDSLEGITHSVCTIEFEDHRPLYDWFLEALGIHHPQQIEFAPLNLTYTVLSKRKLTRLVKEGHVQAWNDPRMPTLVALRRRGYTPTAIRRFCERVGVAKRESRVDVALLEHTLREELNLTAPRVMAVLRPLRVIIDNYPENQAEEVEATNNPEDVSAGTRKLPFARELFIERDDFMEDPPHKFFRLAPGREVRLKHTYFIKCEWVDKDPETGEIVALHCSYDPATGGGAAPDGRKVKGTLHWVSAAHAVDAEVRLYTHLFTRENPEATLPGHDFTEAINPRSLETLTNCKVEPGLAQAPPGNRYQFLRHGYFCLDSEDSRPGQLVFNHTVSLRDTWAKIAKRS